MQMKDWRVEKLPMDEGKQGSALMSLSFLWMQVAPAAAHLEKFTLSELDARYLFSVCVSDCVLTHVTW